MHSIDLSGIDRLVRRFHRIANPQYKLIAQTLMNIIDDDNRKGVLAGLDKDGNPLTKTKYRPISPGAKLTAAQRKNKNPKARAGAYNPGRNANLTSAEYRRLDGPPLAPRRQFSRVVTNLVTDFDDSKPHQLKVWGFWRGVVSKKGRAFLKYHFKGEGHNPVRDLRGVRPESRKRAQKAFRNWMLDQIRHFDV